MLMVGKMGSRAVNVKKKMHNHTSSHRDFPKEDELCHLGITTEKN
jgi:hypothetical protein